MELGRRPATPRRRLDYSAVGGFEKASRLQPGAESAREFACAVDDLTTDDGRLDHILVTHSLDAGQRLRR